MPLSILLYMGKWKEVGFPSLLSVFRWKHRGTTRGVRRDLKDFGGFLCETKIGGWIFFNHSF